jgi:ABC-type multidrug transport system fused ATPase/permease subunit
VQNFASTSLLDIVIDVLTIAGMLAVMFTLNWRFTLVALAVTPLVAVFVMRPAHRRSDCAATRLGSVSLYRRLNSALIPRQASCMVFVPTMPDAKTWARIGWSSADRTYYASGYR